MPDTPVISQVTLTRQRDTVVGHRVGEDGDMLVMACRELPLFLAGVRLKRGESVDVELRGVPLGPPYQKGDSDMAMLRQRLADERQLNIRLTADLNRLRDAKDAQERRHALELAQRDAPDGWRTRDGVRNDVSPSEENP